MALANANNTIATIGRNIPQPFRDHVSPGKFSERYTNNFNKIKFNMIFNLPTTNYFLSFCKTNTIYCKVLYFSPMGIYK
jgi:hypothetical protein